MHGESGVNVVSDNNILTVFCDGPPDNDGNPTHERREVKRYVRKFDANGGFFWSAITGADDPRPKPSHGWKLRFHCRVCGFDEKRSNGIDERKLRPRRLRIHYADVRNF